MDDEALDPGEDDFGVLWSGDGAEVLVLESEARDEAEVERWRKRFKGVRDFKRLSIESVYVEADCQRENSLLVR